MDVTLSQKPQTKPPIVATVTFTEDERDELRRLFHRMPNILKLSIVDQLVNKLAYTPVSVD